VIVKTQNNDHRRFSLSVYVVLLTADIGSVFFGTKEELKTGQVLVRFDLHFLTGQIAKKPNCLVKNRTPGNPSRIFSHFTDIQH